MQYGASNLAYKKLYFVFIRFTRSWTGFKIFVWKIFVSIIKIHLHISANFELISLQERNLWPNMAMLKVSFKSFLTPINYIAFCF